MKVDYLIVLAAFLSIGAVFWSPIIALRVQRRLDEDKEKRNRKLWIYKALMSNRATRLNINYVQALNMIDVEFTEPKEKEVRDAWKELLDHYSEWGSKTQAQRVIDDKADVGKSTEYLAQILVKMGKTLGYDFDKVYLKKSIYYPEGLFDIERELHALRKAALSLLSGTGTKFPVAVFTQDFQPISVRPLSQEDDT